MGHGHNDFGERMKVPDYRKYKVENHPELLQLQRALASVGLKDPWIRNDCWRYDYKEWGTPNQRLASVCLRGMKWGFVAALATIALDTLYDKVYNKDKHGHGHH